MSFTTFSDTQVKINIYSVISLLTSKIIEKTTVIIAEKIFNFLKIFFLIVSIFFLIFS